MLLTMIISATLFCGTPVEKETSTTPRFTEMILENEIKIPKAEISLAR